MIILINMQWIQIEGKYSTGSELTFYNGYDVL
jgi:hypothetical protein